MKRIYNNFLLLLICLSGFSACDDVMDTHKAFIEGEKLYMLLSRILSFLWPVKIGSN